MLVFFLLAVVLTLIVLALLLPSLLRQRQQSDIVDRRQVNIAIAKNQLAELEQKLHDGELPSKDFDDERLRLEKDLAADLEATPVEHPDRGRWMVWPVCVALPVLAGALYLTVGTPDAIDPANRAPVASQAASQAAPDLNEVVRRIEEQLVKEPDSATGWFMLGRARMALGQFQPAIDDFRKSYSLDNSNPEVMVRLAGALATNQAGSLLGEPESLLSEALELQPDNPQALWLFGIAQSEAGEFAAAIESWNKVKPAIAGDFQTQQELQQLIDGAQRSLSAQAEKAGETVADTAAVVETTDSNATSADTGLTVSVSIKEGLADELAPGAVVYVYARASAGPPMPLAVARKSLGDIPFTVVLSDADAMMPQMKLSAFDQVDVGARISLDGTAIAKPGDIFGELTEIDSGRAETLSIEISDVVQ